MESESILSHKEVEDAYREGLFDRILDGTIPRYVQELEKRTAERVRKLERKFRFFQKPAEHIDWLIENGYLSVDGDSPDLSLEDYLALRRTLQQLRRKRREYEELKYSHQDSSEEESLKRERLSREIGELQELIEKINSYLRRNEKVKRGEEEISSAVERIRASSERIRDRMEAFIHLLKTADESNYDYIAEDRDDQILDAKYRLDKMMKRALAHENLFEYALFSFAKKNGENMLDVLRRVEEREKSYIKKIRSYFADAVERGDLRIEDIIAWGNNYGYHKALLERLQNGSAVKVLQFAADELNDGVAKKLLNERELPLRIWNAYRIIAGRGDTWIKYKFPYLYEHYQKRVREERERQKRSRKERGE